MLLILAVNHYKAFFQTYENCYSECTIHEESEVKKITIVFLKYVLYVLSNNCKEKKVVLVFNINEKFSYPKKSLHKMQTKESLQLNKQKKPKWII